MKQHNSKYLLIILIVSVTMTGPVIAFAESPVELVEKGNAAYNAGNFDDALSAYDKAAGERPSDARIYFNKGAAFFRKGDLDKAKDAWEKAALGATETPVEAEALYNLGTLEFSKATQTEAADPKAALEAGGRSVRYYHEAKDLLNKSPKNRNNPLILDASENIELVRRTMKSIQEALDRQKETAQNQQQAAEDLKKLIEQQADLNARTQSQPEKSQSPDVKSSEEKPQEAGQPQKEPLKDPLTGMAKEQDQLREQTQKTAEKLTQSDASSPPAQSPSQPTPDPAEAAKDHLNEAQARQSAAVDQLRAGQVRDGQVRSGEQENAGQENNGQAPPDAVKNQEAALKEMKSALDLLQYKDSQNKDGQDKDSQSKDGQKQAGKSSSDQAKQPDQGEQKQDVQTKPKDQPQPQDQQNQAMQTDAQNQENKPGSESAFPMVRMPDDAERILGEEKENKKIRRQVGSGGYQNVDKDW